MPRETQTERRARQRREEELRQEEKFSKARNAQASYGAALRSYAKQIANIIWHHAEGDPPMVPAHRLPALNEALRRYREGTMPWAHAAAWKMIREVERRNLTAWKQHAKGMSIALKMEILNAPTGERMLELLAEQVKLIRSISEEAAEQVHENTLNALYAGERELPEGELEEALAKANPSWSEVRLRNRATLISRTETARTASVLVQARSEYIGAEEYEWLTAGDWKVRPNHRKLNHTRQRWDDPPESDPPLHSHPGQIFNCRCTALPIIPE